jgi:hypothetical protein
MHVFFVINIAKHYFFKLPKGLLSFLPSQALSPYLSDPIPLDSGHFLCFPTTLSSNNLTLRLSELPC